MASDNNALRRRVAELMGDVNEARARTERMRSNAKHFERQFMFLMKELQQAPKPDKNPSPEWCEQYAIWYERIHK